MSTHNANAFLGRHEDDLCCPRCGGSDGYYEKWLESHEYNFFFDGCGDGEADVAGGRGGKRKYCRNCGGDITNFVNSLEKAKGEKK